MRTWLPCILLLCACDDPGRNVPRDRSALVDASQPEGDGGTPIGCGGELEGCYTVYAHSARVLYRIDLANKQLVEVGPFNAPKVGSAEDSMTDLAVAPDDTIYVISKTSLYTASPLDGHVSLVGALGDQLKNCGSDAVAFTFMPDGKLYAGDHEGNFCRIDMGAKPTVTHVGTLGQDLGFAGDIVAVADGTIYATVWTLSDPASTKNNSLAKIDPATGRALEVIGMTGFPLLYGISFEEGKVFGFTGDGSGDVVTINPKTGKGTRYGTFKDPSTSKGIPFWGAGVNANVAPPIG